MAVIAYRELARTAKHLLGQSPEYERRFIATLDNPDTSAIDVVAACSCDHGTSHPELAEAICNDLEVNEQYEGNRYWVEVVARYIIPPNDDQDLLPWLRPPVWKFTTQGVAVPALYYWDGTTQKPLTNSAGDYFEGLTVDEAQQRVTIESNRQTFPSALAAAITNCLNTSTYLGFAQDGIKVQGISGERVSEQIEGETVYYWKVTSELLCRQSGWNLMLPDVGYNYIEGGQKKRAWVIGPPPDEAEVASANPVGLNGSGAMVAGGTLPAVLTRRVYKRIAMADYFGTPPT